MSTVQIYNTDVSTSPPSSWWTGVQVYTYVLTVITDVLGSTLNSYVNSYVQPFQSLLMISLGCVGCGFRILKTQHITDNDETQTRWGSSQGYYQPTRTQCWRTSERRHMAGYERNSCRKKNTNKKPNNFKKNEKFH